MERAPVQLDRGPGRAGLLLTVLVGAALLGATFAGDGSDVGGILPVGGAAVLLLAAFALAIGIGKAPVPTLGRSGTLLVLAMLALVAWIGATVIWSVVPDRS